LKKFKLSKIFSFLGPYPYNPYFIFLFFFALFFSRYVPIVADQPQGSARWQAGGLIMLLASFPSLLFALMAYLIQKYRFWSSSNFFYYVLELGFGQSIHFIVSPYIQRILRDAPRVKSKAPVTLIGLTPNIFFASLFLAIIVFALMHRAERIIALRLTDADDLVKRLESDREELIKSDEELRRQTSQFLHDRVQSELMAVGIKLRSVAEKTEVDVSAVINQAITRLEKTRTSDLRNLVQILAPNFETNGLAQALQNLSSPYQATMLVSIEVDEATEKLDSKILLGIFRIVEQSLLNSLVHGPAKQISISVINQPGKNIELIVRDNGPGANLEKIGFGVGSAVIDSWVSMLKGQKEIITSPGTGYRLQVLLPI